MRRCLRILSAAGPSLVLTVIAADTTIDAVKKHPWAGNTGWSNWAANTTDGAVVGGAFLSGYAWAANTGWISFGDGTPANGHSYANGSAADFGVNQDGAGNLSGYAWSANTGWIHFGWASADDANRPRFNLQTGDFSGYAWAANTGWINLGTGLLVTTAIHAPDSDSDGIADAWEMQHFGSLATAGATTDTDKDGVADAAEYEANTDPEDATSFLRVQTQDYDSGHTEVTLTFPTNPARLYRIEHSADMATTPPWTISSHGTFAPDAGTTTTRMVVFPAGPRRFFRVVAVLPLSP